MRKIIEVEGLSKSFGTVQAVDKLSFYVEEGSLFSFLGTNGAGKSTTIAILLTLLKQDAGKATISGYEVGKQDHAIRKEIGVVFQDSVLDRLLTVQENLDIRGSFYGYSKQERQVAIQKVVEITECTTFLHRPYGKLSGGQKRRADIARALLHAPTILILDEPTTGLDPQNRKNIWEMILRLQKEKNMTIFLTTHYIEEAANSDFVVVMKDGAIIAKGTPNQLKDEYSSHRLLMTSQDEIGLQKALQADGFTFTKEKSIIQIELPTTKDAIDILSFYSSFITSFEVRHSSLDDVFIAIHGKDVDHNANNR